MTEMTMTRAPFTTTSLSGSRRRMRTGLAALGAAIVVATTFGPPASPVTTRLGAGETVGLSTVSAADTITSRDVLAEVAAGVRTRVSKLV